MDNIFLTFELNINTVKVMVCNKQNELDINILLKVNRIEQINQFKYLGSI